MKKGDKVHLRNREEVTGEIIDTKTEYLWGMDYTQYKVKYDDKNLCPQEDWHDEIHLILLPELPKGNNTWYKCECGVDKVMPNGKHSDWCPLYRG